MFCADYIAAFVYHAIITIGSVHFFDRFYDKSEESANLLGDYNNGQESSISDILKARIVISGLAINGLGIKCKIHSTNTEHGRQTPPIEKSTGSVIPFCVGIASGLAASATLYPFDFVRSGVLKPGLSRIMSAGSTIPYAGALYGIYFSCRDPEKLSSQIKWAGVASTSALLAEVPFDQAKRTMFGNTRLMLGAGLLYVPFASLMLVMYDKAAIKLVSPIISKELTFH